MSKWQLVLGVILLAPAVASAASEERSEDLILHTGAGCLHHRLDGWDGRGAAEAWDEPTGRDLRNFPPDRVADLLHMKLEMRFEDLADRAFTATETLSFAPIAVAADALALDAKGLDIRAVRLDDAPVDFFHDGERLTLTFDAPLAAGRERTIEIDYRCADPIRGMIFTPAAPETPGYAAEVHTDGQPEDNGHWFVCHDFPNERMSTELVIDVPAGLSACSNGRLVSHAEAGGRATWHWIQEKPHVAYLVFMAAGPFARVELEHPRVPMTVWCRPEQAADVQRTFGPTGAMIDVFEDRFGVPYPWPRYDNVVVRNFAPGGMENTSCTALYPTAVLDERAHLDRDLDALNSHELAHQWTGDLITCKSWAHIWLNEGWATYGESLWFEHRDGEDGYLDDVRNNFRVARRDSTDRPHPMVSPVYENPGDTFRRPANPYPKGASVLHMLRRMLGDEVFFAGVRRYMSRHAGGLVETSDLRYALEEVSGRGLEGFFDQWCYRPGSPALEVDARYEPLSRELRVDVEQTQTIDARTPAFRFALPVHVITDRGAETFTIDVTERSTSFRRGLDAAPRQIVIDPDLHVLKTIEVTKALPLWMRQAEAGPTIAARHAAVEALGETDAPETIALLARIARDPGERHTLRRNAVASLGRYGSAEARQALLALLEESATGAIAEARVRARIVDAASRIEDEPIVPARLAVIADTDVSYATRVEAIQGIARLEAGAHADLVARLVHYPSQHAQIRNAALAALADLDDPRGLDLGIECAAYGNPDRSRPRAVAAVAELAHHDPDRAFALLNHLLDDPERRTRRAAISALGDTGDERAKPRLRSIAETDRDPRMRRAAERAVEKLEEAS